MPLRQCSGADGQATPPAIDGFRDMTRHAVSPRYIYDRIRTTPPGDARSISEDGAVFDS
jgi:hypothetical protein